MQGRTLRHGCSGLGDRSERRGHGGGESAENEAVCSIEMLAKRIAGANSL